MPVIMPIKDIETTNELIAYKEQKPSSELYDRKEYRIDQAIYESEKEMENGGKAITLAEARTMLDKKYYG